VRALRYDIQGKNPKLARSKLLFTYDLSLYYMAPDCHGVLRRHDVHFHPKKKLLIGPGIAEPCTISDLGSKSLKVFRSIGSSARMQMFLRYTFYH
jgi:hypothetical protein